MIFALFLMAAEPQVDCTNAMTQADMNSCSYRDYQAADTALNAAWEQAATTARNGEKQGERGAFERLLDAQRKWLAYRDAECLAISGPREQSGTIWPLLQNGCRTTLTEERTARLHEYAEGQR